MHKTINTHGRTMTGLEEAAGRINAEGNSFGWVQVGYDRETGEVITHWVEKGHWVQWRDPDIINIPLGYDLALPRPQFPNPGIFYRAHLRADLGRRHRPRHVRRARIQPLLTMAGPATSILSPFISPAENESYKSPGLLPAPSKKGS